MRTFISKELYNKLTNIEESKALVLLTLIFFLVSKYNLSSYCKHFYPSINPLNDIDLTVSTDFEDFAIIVSDVFEVLEHDRALLVDGGFEIFLTRSLTSFSSLSTATLR